MPKTLTAAAVRVHKPGNGRREIPDGGVPGLRLVIQSSGAKSWAMRFRRPNGSSGKLTLGTADVTGQEREQQPQLGGHLTLAAARRLATEVQRQRALGRDVISDWAHEKQRRQLALADTFATAARTFIEEHARPKTRRWHETARLLGLRPDQLAIIPRGLADRWRDKPVAAISGHDVHALIDEVRRRGAPGLERRRDGMTESRARAMFACLSKFFAWLVARRMIEQNPCASVHRPAVAARRDRVLTDNELRWYWTACDNKNVAEPFGQLLKLLLVTGQRLNEIARMKRTELSEDCESWMLPKERTKNKRPHVVPLVPLAKEIIGRVKLCSGTDFVFTTNGRTPVSGFSKIKRRLDENMLALARNEAAEAGRDPGDVVIPDWRLHDLRRTVASGLQRVGVPLPVTEKILNHTSGSFGGIVGVYQCHEYPEERRAALEAWVGLLSRIVERPRKNVEPLPLMGLSRARIEQ